MRWLSNIKMKEKLLLLLLLPCLVLIALATRTILYNYYDMKNNNQADAWAALVVKLDNILDHLEEERQLSIQSITDETFSNPQDLTEARESVNESILIFKNKLSNLEWSINSNSLKNTFQKVVNYLDTLNLKRAQIDTKNLSPTDIETYFANYENNTNEVLGQMILNSQIQSFIKELLLYLHINQEEVEAFHELNIISQKPTQSELSPTLYPKLLSTIKGQEDAFHNFSNLASLEDKEQYTSLLKNNPTADLDRFHRSLLTTGHLNPDLNFQSWKDALLVKIRLLKDFEDLLLERIDFITNETIKNDYWKLITLLGLLLAVGIITFIIARAIIKNIIDGLQSASKLADEVSQGNLTSTSFTTNRKDELGDLEQSLHKMVSDLRSLNLKLQEEVEVLATSTAEILSSITRVSSGTSETATAVTETTTTIEELKQTAQIATEKANDVLTSSEHTLNTLKKSENSLDGTIEDMRQIQGRMSTISESIIKLSEHSQAIGKIIDTVNDLAEQSNLLAVNAAIEAAKASEHGKGFSVVAQEVRSLAEQSKEATVQVYTILNDIQNATSSTVMATEQGTKAVSQGVQRSLETNAALKSLAEGVKKVTHNSKQITISNQQQLVGVDQVNIAMANIKEASNQHVEHMLQIKTAVKNLNNVGQSLKALVEQYKL